MSFFEQFGKIIPPPNILPITAPELPAYLGDLERSINENHDKISTLLGELGAAYYERHKNEHHTEFEEKLEAIRAVYAEINQYQKLVDEVSTRKRCPACGAELMEGAVFCSLCGTRIPEAANSPEGQKVCPQCHAAVDPEDAFCSLCGADLRKNEESGCV